MTTATQEKRSTPLSIYVLAVLTLLGVVAGVYRLVVGLYRSEDGQRLLLTDHSDSLFLDTIEIQ